jgi:hypothetical protein
MILSTKINQVKSYFGMVSKYYAAIKNAKRDALIVVEVEFASMVSEKGNAMIVGVGYVNMKNSNRCVLNAFQPHFVVMENGNHGAQIVGAGEFANIVNERNNV